MKYSGMLGLKAIISFFPLAVLLVAAVLSTHKEWLDHYHFLLPTENTHMYNTQIVSLDPLMIYTDNFVSTLEIQELLSIGESSFERSRVGDHQRPDNEPDLTSHPKVSESRTSSSAFLPGTIPTVATIKRRAASFLGLIPYDSIEVVQLVRYVEGQKVNVHPDWFTDSPRSPQGRRFNRLASFFIYLDANCTEGETWFPHIEPVVDRSNHSNIFYRSLGDRTGIGFIPKAGSGIFWINLRPDNSGDERTEHAGLPVGDGSKVGMNIWVRKYFD